MRKVLDKNTTDQNWVPDVENRVSALIDDAVTEKDLTISYIHTGLATYFTLLGKILNLCHTIYFLKSLFGLRSDQFELIYTKKC